MRRRKILAGVLAGLMAMTMLGGCGSSSKQEARWSEVKI